MDTQLASSSIRLRNIRSMEILCSCRKRLRNVNTINAIQQLMLLLCLPIVNVNLFVYLFIIIIPFERRQTTDDRDLTCHDRSPIKTRCAKSGTNVIHLSEAARRVISSSVLLSSRSTSSFFSFLFCLTRRRDATTFCRLSSTSDSSIRMVCN